jgi:hypothetical protein
LISLEAPVRIWRILSGEIGNRCFSKSIYGNALCIPFCNGYLSIISPLHSPELNKWGIEYTKDPKEREYPWTAVRIYLQLDNLSQDYVDAIISLSNGSYYSFLSKPCQKGEIGFSNGLEFPAFLSLSLSSREGLLIFLNKNLSAPKEYKTIGLVDAGNAADIRFSTEDIKDEETNEPILFMATGGKVTLGS